MYTTSTVCFCRTKKNANEKRMMGRTSFSESEIAFIQRQRVGRLGTSDAEGHPYVVPVCYIFDGSHFIIALDEKPKSVEVQRLKRVRNIEARHEASLLIDHYSDDWTQLAYVLVYGRAGLVPPGHSWHAQALPLLRARYIQYQTMALETLPMIVITPERVTSWFASA
jgi:PPOX class probable F420-dependent enzyme